jgi:hypothetical protein
MSVALMIIDGKERRVWEDGKRKGVGGPEEKDNCDSGKRCGNRDKAS